jgi:ATP-dependent Clp protease protease subunit
MTTLPSKALLERQKLEAEIGLINTKQEVEDEKFYQLEYERLEYEASRDARRVFNFHAPVGGGSVATCIAMLDAWSHRDPGKDITIILNSPGGSVIEGFALQDFLEELKGRGHHLTIVVRGYAASMGGILLQAGDKRIIGKNAYVLIHEISSGNVGKLSEMEDELKFLNKLAGRALDILSSKSTMSKEQIKRKWKYKDWWLDSDEAVRLGFADEIG